VTGDGALKGQGFLTLDEWSGSTYERGKLEQVDSGAVDTVTALGLKALQNSLLEEYQSNAVWVMRRSTWGAVIALQNGINDFQLNFNSLREGDPLILLGKRVILMDDMPDLEAASLSIAYGDFGMGYTIVEQPGFRVIRDDVTDKGKIKLYTYKFIGSAVTSFDSIKIQVTQV